MTEYEKMMAGLAHLPAKDELTQMRNKAKELLFELNNKTSPTDEKSINSLLQKLFGKADETTSVNAPFHCDYGINIKVGKNFFANYHCVMLDNVGITIGDNVMFAPNVGLYTIGHPLDSELRKAGWEQGKPITIGDNVWVGANTIILGGVTIGENAVIGAGSLVTKDIPANTLAFGNPCKIIRKITPEDKENYIKIFKPF